MKRIILALFTMAALSACSSGTNQHNGYPHSTSSAAPMQAKPMGMNMHTCEHCECDMHKKSATKTYKKHSAKKISSRTSVKAVEPSRAAPAEGKAAPAAKQ
jgi:hypothetical protein